MLSFFLNNIYLKKKTKETVYTVLKNININLVSFFYLLIIDLLLKSLL